MICSALLNLERYRCRCGWDAACDCPPLVVEVHVVGVVDGSSNEFAVDISGAAEMVSGLVVELTPREEMWATLELCADYERRERLEEEERSKRVASLRIVRAEELPYVV